MPDGGGDSIAKSVEYTWSDEALMIDEKTSAGPGGRSGTVYLVGAGPGDPDLLTVKAVRLLKRADVIVHDALIGGEILRMVPSSARVIDVGKRCGGRRTAQSRINEILVDAAANAKTVIRLKGGDPFVFGRGGEEAIALAEAGVRFRVVPGITAGVGASAYAGIPVTHRDAASSVTFVTGHEDPTRAEARVDWDALARIEGTVVVYMGVGNLARISDRLVAGGRSPCTPVAVIEWGTLARQRTVEGRLVDIAERADAAAIRAPALVVIGEVAALRSRIAWFDTRPLTGRRVLVARSRPQPSRIAASLRRLGADVVDLPALRDVAEPLTGETEARLADLTGYAWLLFSSPAGVDHFWRLLRASGRDSRSLGAAKVASLGAATTTALRRHGIEPDVATRTFEVDAVASALATASGVSGLRVLFPRESNLGSAISVDLRDRGAAVDDLGVFRTVPDHRFAGHDDGHFDFVVLPSSTAARALLSTGVAVPPEACVVAIGPSTARVAEASGLAVDQVAAEATMEGVVAAIRRIAAASVNANESLPHPAVAAG